MMWLLILGYTCCVIASAAEKKNYDWVCFLFGGVGFPMMGMFIYHFGNLIIAALEKYVGI